MYICKICGHGFEPTKEGHYIARDPGVTGAFSGLGSHDEDHLYDAFDCPNCGCQYIAQDRKYKTAMDDPVTEEEEEKEDG